MPDLNCRYLGAGRSVVLLHPVGLDGAFWGALPRRLATGYRVVAPDFAGHGASAPSARPGRIEDHVAQVARLLDGQPPAVLVGVSFGGMVAQNLALARPDLVAGLILAATPGEIGEALRPAILARGTAAEAGGMEAVAETTLERWFTPAFKADPVVETVRQRLLANRPQDFAATWEAVSTHRALPRLGEVTCPALVIAGSLDPATPRAASEALAAALPNARLEIIEGAPHMLQLEREAEFTMLVETFLQEHLA